MIELIYESSSGKKLNLTQLPYWTNVEPIFDYEWDYTERDRRRGSIVAGFTKKVATKQLVLHILGENKAQRDLAIDEFNSAIETDIYNGTPGKIWCGDWYTLGYIVASKNEKWQYDKPVVKKTITLVREQESWFRKIVKKSYESNMIKPDPEEWDKDFEPNYDYKYDFMTDFDASVKLINPDVLPSNFILNIQGYAEQPEIHIGENVIQFNLEVPHGAVLQVSAITKKTTMTLADRTEINVFGARSPDYYIFQRLPSGVNTVTWNGMFDWEITLFEERSEPRWPTV